VAYSKRQLEDAWVRAGGKSNLASTMAAIAGAESNFGASPYGDKGVDGSGFTSFGPWQVHTPAHPQYDPTQLVSNLDYSAKAAVEISGNRVSGLGNWTTYKTGAFRSHFSGGPSASTPGANGGSGGGAFKLPGQGAVEGATETLLSPFAAIGKGATATAKLAQAVGEWVAEPMKPLKLVGGGILIYMGLRSLTRTGVGSSVASEARFQAASVRKVPTPARAVRRMVKPKGGGST
jgi:hypothetical protein